MRFQFDANQAYQIQAIEAVADLFDGQARTPAGAEWGVAAIPNRLDLSEGILLANLQAVQATRGISADTALVCIERTVELADGAASVRFPNFSVEMETGTGKTYVYIRTALELSRRYGMRKFIIVVPSVAIREGVLKTFEMTRQHFAALYDNAAYSWNVYDSENLTRVRAFAQADSVEFMVMTIDSFNKASNIFRQSTDKLMGETPMHLVQATRPILILDEPQNMESENSVAALAALNPLFALRYSATHRNAYTLVYRLTPADAYHERLVKRIEVAGMVERDDYSQAYVRVESIESKKNTVTARLAIHKLMRTGAVSEQTVTVRYDDDLEALAGRPEYAGFVVEEISVGGEYVRFTNGVEARRGVAQGPDREALFRAQIRYTIEEHMRRQRRLRGQGIKVLSLFFIDRVENYAPPQSLLRRLFAQEFEEARRGYAEWRDVDASAVHAGYFAQRRTKSEVETIDSVSGKTAADIETYDLIMKDKERLLSFEEPVAFIFSHSALREGWDNPNVFQICTLNQSVSEVKKRQEVGRGMRLAVDQAGERVRDDTVNVLTVVANESYERFVGKLQEEIEDEFGVEGAPPRPINAREREKHVARLVTARVLSPEFQALWNRIRAKTRYSVSIDSERLVREAASEVARITVEAPRLTVQKASVEIRETGQFYAAPTTGAKTVAHLEGRAPLPDLLALIDNLMERTTPPVHISRRTTLAILREASNMGEAVKNPQEFATRVARILKDKLADQLAEGIQYEQVEEWYEMTELKDEVPSFKELVPATKSIYDAIGCDSAVERRFLEGLERHDCVRLYVKLPNWFKVATPLGDYNPDWAIVWEERDGHGDTRDMLLYLVRETKDTIELTELPDDERRKVICGSRHFNAALGGDYQVVSATSQLPEGGRKP